MSFLFKCCKNDTSNKQVYQIEKRQGNTIKTQFVSDINDVKDLKNADRVLKVNRSDYNQLIKKYDANNKFTDPTFPPGSKSLGNIKNVPVDCQWKRISQISQKPQLFVDRIQPQDVIQGSLGDCYFLSAVSALSQKSGRIQKVFGNQQFSPAGIYKVTLRIDGIIQQIVIDDYIPVNRSNRPLFCQPHKNQFWVVLLEKAWAKAHDSYANINSGTPSEVFKAVTYAPSQLRPIKSQSLDKLWADILQNSIKDNPICCGTSTDDKIHWNQLGLTCGHAYTLIDASLLKDQSGQQHRMLKIRNPWGFNQWSGSGSEKDHSFWARIPKSLQKQNFTGSTPFGNDGIFFMKFQDFCNHFNQVHFCHLLDNAVYQVQPIYSNGKQGSIFSINVKNQDSYIFQLHQSGIKSENDFRLKQGLNRSTILLAKGSNYEFVDGSLKYQQEDNSIKVHLVPGQYFIYTQIDPTLNSKLMPESMSISSYSRHYVDIKPANMKIQSDFFHKIFLSYARNNRRKQFNQGLMWISWKLLFQKGGFAYLAFGVDHKSDKKFVITINQSDFTNLGYQLKQPHRGKGKQTFQVRPGSQEIIVSRVINAALQAMKFPPPMDIQIQKA